MYLLGNLIELLLTGLIFFCFLIVQLVDGVLTSDSDALLYGARTVYRNLEAQNKARST